MALTPEGEGAMATNRIEQKVKMTWWQEVAVVEMGGHKVSQGKRCHTR